LFYEVNNFVSKLDNIASVLGPRFVVQIGEKVIDYNEEFRLFLTTRNPAPEIPPDAASVITEVNFTTTRAGLTGQVSLSTLWFNIQLRGEGVNN
jgi:hypothetical protein